MFVERTSVGLDVHAAKIVAAVLDGESGEVECLFTLDAPVYAVTVIPDRRMIMAGDRSGRVHDEAHLEEPMVTRTALAPGASFAPSSMSETARAGSLCP